MYTHWDEETKTAEVITEVDGRVFTGKAVCHKDDYDVCSEKVGLEIAFQRACISYLRYIRDCELFPALKALKQLYYSMNRSKEFRERSYEARMLYRSIQRYEDDIKAVRDEIKEKQEYIKNYINQKDEFYKTLRKIRKNK